MNHSAIKWIARFGRDRITLLIVVLAGLGTAHILVRTATYGAAVTTDSISFLSTALNFFAGEGWRDLAGKPLVRWPPLFPLLLAAFGWVGIDPLEAGRLINATAFGLTILAAGCWLRSNLRSRLLVLAATATLAASLPLSRWAAHLMSELLFVLLTLLALIQLATFLNRQTDAPLWWAAVFTALAALTRYAGVALIGTGVLMLLVRRAPPLAARLKHAIAYGAISSIPLAGVLTYNWAVSGTLTGWREASGQSLSDGLSRAADVFREWAIPPNAPDGFGYLLSIAAGLVVLAAGAVVVWSGRSVGMDGQTFGLGPALPFGVFAVAYLVLIVVIVPLVIPVEFPVRYLLPMYVPLLLAGVFLLDRLLCIEAAGWMAAGRYIAGVPRRADHPRPYRLLGARKPPSYRPSVESRIRRKLDVQHRPLATFQALVLPAGQPHRGPDLQQHQRPCLVCESDRGPKQVPRNLEQDAVGPDRGRGAYRLV